MVIIIKPVLDPMIVHRRLDRVAGRARLECWRGKLSPVLSLCYGTLRLERWRGELGRVLSLC